jgi:RNA-splicing ligase RtcB
MVYAHEDALHRVRRADKYPLHSGSRNIGKTIGECAIHMARTLAEAKETHLRDRDLAWLDEGTVEFDMYVEGLRWAQDYAAHNRALMMRAVLLVLREEFGREVATFEGAINCHHNYANVQTAGIECRKDAGVLDQIPGAYKSIDAVMAVQADLVEIVHTLKQVMCIKG